MSGYTEKEVSEGMSPEAKEDYFKGTMTMLIERSDGNIDKGVFINNGELWPKADIPEKLK